MPCEHYKNALIDAAASGAAPSEELRAHLSECASCRAVFAQEQSLFAAIDSGVHAAANSEVLPSLLPGLRTRIDEQVVAGRAGISKRFVLAGAAIAIVALFAARTVWHSNIEPRPPAIAESKSSSPPAFQSAQSPFSTAPSGKGTTSPRLHASSPKNSATLEAVEQTSMPEVLVPRDQEALLVNYAEEWQRHGRAPLVASDAKWAAITPLQPIPIQITELDVKPLADEKSQ